MRVVPRRSKGRQGTQEKEPPAVQETAHRPGNVPRAPEKAGRRDRRRAADKPVPPPAVKPAEAVEAAEPVAAVKSAEATKPAQPAKAAKPGRKERRRAKKQAKKQGKKQILPAVEAEKSAAGKSATETKPLERPAVEAPLPADPDQRRRARVSQRQRTAAEVKRSRAALRGDRTRQTQRERAAREHRAALLVMVLTLGLLIAAVAVTGAMIATSRRAQPITLAAPLHIYPVAQVTAGQCPAGTPGITGPSATGPTCYRLNQGIAIRKVADLRVQRSAGGSGHDVAVALRSADQRAFADLTRATVGRQVVFVVREQLVTAPRVDTPITDGKVVITGPPSRPEAEKILRELRGR
ncbi:SecDF P1 head subdomain-containing protein [Spirillospora sp. CA-253888]